MLYKTEWLWELKTWSGKMTLMILQQILPTSSIETYGDNQQMRTYILILGFTGFILIFPRVYLSLFRDRGGGGAGRAAAPPLFCAPAPTFWKSNTMILFLFSIFNMKKLFSIVSPPTFHLAPRPLLLHDSRTGPRRTWKAIFVQGGLKFSRHEMMRLCLLQNKPYIWEKICHFF